MTTTPAPSFDAGAVRITMPAGYREHTRFVLLAPGTKVVVSRFDDRAATPTEVAARVRGKVADITSGAATITREGPLKVGERPAEVTIVRIKESSGEVVTVCTLLLELAAHRYADITLEGARAEALYNEVVPTVRAGATQAPATKGRTVHDFIELSFALPVEFVRSTPYAFSHADAGIEWTADAARVESPAYASLARTMIDTLAGKPGVVSRDVREGSTVGVVHSADLTDVELGGVGDRVVRAEVFLNGGATKLIVQGRSPRAGVLVQEKDLQSILAMATPAGGAR